MQIAGYGEYEDGLRRLLAALDRGDLDDAREVARLGRGLEGGEEEPLPILSAFFSDPPGGYLEAARGIAGSVEFVGRLEHDEVAALLPDAEILVMPSTFPEAFGMVAAEAAACGALPISADHSGMREVSRQLAAAPAGDIGRRLTCSRSRRGRSRRSRTASTAGWRCRRPSARPVGRPWSSTSRRLWGWEGVARGVLSASRGELDRLPLA